MIRLEQVCRYRKDKGYGISAKTPGITAEQAELLGEVFNDSMNALFPKVGTSYLSCVNEGGNLFYARNTLLTDAHGRISLYTHSYVLPENGYVRLLEEEPTALLQIPMHQLMDAPGGNALEPLMLQVNPLDVTVLERLMRKYDLTEERYADLLYSAYDAIFHHTPLHLVTSRPFEEREQMVRELAVCVMAGLLPCMRRHLSFSSGPDSRMCLNVVEEGKQLNWFDREDAFFGVEDDELTNVRISDPFTGAFFDDVARTSGKAREELLQMVQYTIRVDLKREIPSSVMMVATAYARTYGDGGPENKLYVFCGLKSCAGQGVADGVADGMMTHILRELHEAGVVDLNLISHMADWYLRRSSKEYRELANEILTLRANSDVCVALTGITLRTKDTDNKAELIGVLMKKAPLESPKWTVPDKKRLFHWIVSTDQQNMLGYVDELLLLVGPDMPQELENILQDASGCTLSAVKIGVLRKMMERILQDDLTLSELACGYLDSHIKDFTEAVDADATARRQLVCYFLDKRLDQRAPMETQAKNLLRHASLAAPYCDCLEAELLNRSEAAFAAFKAAEAGKNTGWRALAAQQLSEGKKKWVQHCLRWEYYMAEKCMGPQTVAEEIPQICRSSNSFQHDGYFEKKAEEILRRGALDQLRNLLEKLVIPKDAKSEELYNALEEHTYRLQNWVLKWLGCVESMGDSKSLSVDVCTRLMKAIVDTYWLHVDIREIFRCPTKSENIIRQSTAYLGEPRSKAMCELKAAVASYLVKLSGRRTRTAETDLYKPVTEMWKHDPDTREPIRKELERLLIKHMKAGRDFPLDIIVLCGEEPDGSLNGKRMHELMDKLNIAIENGMNEANPKRSRPAVSISNSSYLKIGNARERKQKIMRALKSVLGSRSALEDGLIHELSKPGIDTRRF